MENRDIIGREKEMPPKGVIFSDFMLTFACH
jgi:hypothetical protein